MESTFINGLKPEVRAEVRMLKPSGLGRIMELAQQVEDSNTILRPSKGARPSPAPTGSRNTGSVSSLSPTYHSSSFVQLLSIHKPQAVAPRTSLKSNFPFRRLIDSELQQKHEKGLFPL